jgi:hypothetical protein
VRWRDEMKKEEVAGGAEVEKKYVYEEKMGKLQKFINRRKLSQTN